MISFPPSIACSHEQLHLPHAADIIMLTDMKVFGIYTLPGNYGPKAHTRVGRDATVEQIPLHGFRKHLLIETT